MSKPTAPAFEFGTYEGPAAAVNPWGEHVDALIAHNDSKGNQDGTITIRVEAGAGNRQRVLFQQAANAKDKTARVVQSAYAEVGADGEYADDAEDVLTFRLKDKEAARPGRGGKGKGATVGVVEATA